MSLQRQFKAETEKYRALALQPAASAADSSPTRGERVKLVRRSDRAEPAAGAPEADGARSGAAVRGRLRRELGRAATFFAAVHCAGLAVAVAAFAVALARRRRLDLVGQVLCAGGDSRPQSTGPDARAPRARFAVRSHEASSRPALACSSAMRVSSTRDLMSSLRNT